MVDLLPETLQCWQAVEAVAREHFHRSGFGEIRTPLLETTDLFCRGIGEGTDVVGKEMYSFTIAVSVPAHCGQRAPRRWCGRRCNTAC